MTKQHAGILNNQIWFKWMIQFKPTNKQINEYPFHLQEKLNSKCNYQPLGLNIEYMNDSLWSNIYEQMKQK